MDDLSRWMRAAAAEPPPTRIELDRLIAAERRRSRTTAWTAAGTGVAAVIAAMAIAPALLTGSGPGGVSAPAGPPAPGTPVEVTPTPSATLCAPLSPSPTGPQPPLQSHDTVRARPTESVAQAVPRLTAALREALREVLPAGVRMEPLQNGCADPQFQFHPSYRKYDVPARLVRGEHTGHFMVRVMPTPANDPFACHASDDPRDCERLEFPDGTVATAHTMDAGQGGVLQRSVLVRRPDGTTVYVMINNYWMGRDSREPTQTSPDLLLTAEQLIALGRAAGLTLYP